MTQTITDLWNGNIAPCEHCGAHDPQANRLIGEIERNRKALCCVLSDGQRDLLAKFEESTEEYLLRMMELAFQDGFCLAAGLMVEALN